MIFFPSPSNIYWSSRYKIYVIILLLL